jgi:hypothetical protein
LHRLTPVIGKNNIRPPNFDKAQLEIMMDWLETNSDHPYPKKQDLEFMTQQTGLDRKQVHLWCTNARRVIYFVLIIFRGI